MFQSKHAVAPAANLLCSRHEITNLCCKTPSVCLLVPINNGVLTHSLSEPMLYHHIIKPRHPDVRPPSNRKNCDVLLRKLHVPSTVVKAHFASLYDVGGALDSQSSETQFMERLVGRGESYIIAIK